MKEQEIKVSVRSKKFGGTDRDISLLKNVEVRQLILSLENVFKQELCGQYCQIRIVNKGFLIGEGRTLSEFPIADGDIIEIMED